MRVLIVDNEDLFRAGLRSVLKAHSFTIVGEAATAEDAIAQAQTARPEVVLLDTRMPGIAPSEAIHALRSYAGIVIAIVDHDDDDTLQPALEAGAGGYLCRCLSEEQFCELLACFPIPHSTALDGPPSVSGRHDCEPLTTREREVLAVAATGRTNRDIAQSLGISDSTVKFHMANIMAKLDLHHRSQLAWYVLRDANT